MPDDSHDHYRGGIPVADLWIGGMMSGQERRGAGADFVHEFVRLGAAEDRGKMNQAQSLGFRLASESGHGRTRSETNNPGNTAAPGSA